MRHRLRQWRELIRVDGVLLGLAIDIFEEAGRQMNMASIGLDARRRLAKAGLRDIERSDTVRLTGPLTHLLERNGHILVELGLESRHTLQRWRKLRSRKAGNSAQKQALR